MAEIEEVLTEKGWTKADAEAPDALVVIHRATGTKKSLSTFYSGMGGYGRRGGAGTATTTAYESELGTLVVDICEAETKELLFSGSASDELSDEQEKNIKKLDKATSKMFKGFSPEPKKN